MINRRKDKRIELNHPIKISVADLVEEGVLINLSHGGALVQMNGNSHLGSEYLGETGTFLLKPINKPLRRYTGEVIRHYFRDDHHFIVVRFWKPFTVVDGVSL